MDCHDVHERVRNGDDLAPCQAHLDECPACQELAGGVGSGLAGASALSGAPALDFGALEAALGEEQGPLGRLRSLPTPARRGLTLLLAAALGGGLWVAAKEVVMGPAALAAGVLGVLCLVGLWNALRPLHEPPMPRGRWLGLIGLALALPLALACLPPSAQGGGEAPALKCFAVGSILGLPVLLLALALDRAPGAVAIGSGALLAAAAAGGVGNVCLEGLCATGGLGHRVGGHATIALSFCALVYALGRVRSAP